MYDLGKKASVPTTFGNLEVREFGRRGGLLAVALHGKSREEWVRHEWDDVARALAKELGYNVFLPDLHSSSVVAADLGPESLLDLLLQLARWAAGAASLLEPPIPLLMGKSWGAALAARVAALSSESVGGLVLVAPAALEQGSWASLEIRCKAALFWAEDDPSFMRARNVREALHQEVLFYTVHTGGHRILRDYTSRIVGFARTALAPIAAAAASSALDLRETPRGASAGAGEAVSAAPSRWWLFLWVPLLCGPVLFVLMPLRRVFQRAWEGRGRAAAGKGGGGEYQLVHGASTIGAGG